MIKEKSLKHEKMSLSLAPQFERKQSTILDFIAYSIFKAFAKEF